MIKIYHNNRCRKSRCGLQLLEDSGQQFQVVKYLEDIPTFDELKKIISLLVISPIELIRKNESIWKQEYKGKELSDKSIIEAMISHPKLIERPIVINGNQAVIGRPTERILEII